MVCPLISINIYTDIYTYLQVPLLRRVPQLRAGPAGVRGAVPLRLLEDQQGDRLPLLGAARGQRGAEPRGLLRHVHHVQGPHDGAPERAPQVRAPAAQHPHLDAALPAGLHHRDGLLRRDLHVRIPEVHGLHPAAEGEADHRAGRGQDLGVDVLPAHRRHVHPHRPRRLQRAPALRLHHHLQGEIFAYGKNI